MAENDKKDDGDAEPEKPKPRWPWFVAGVVVLGFVGVVLAIIFVPNSKVWTNDAYVMVHYASIAPRISGQVSAVSVDDNDMVPAGQALVTLDDRDQQIAVVSAEAALERDRAQLRDALANVQRQPSLIQQRDFNVTGIQARLALAQADRTRYRNLASSGAGTQQNSQQAESTLAQQQAELAGAKASVEAERHQLDVLKANGEAAQATIHSDEAQLAQAKLTLSYTRIPAPLAGMVSQRSAQVGDYVGPGTTLMTLVPLDRVYIIANYRELALKHVLPGQHVHIHVDAYDIILDGVVQGLPPASGAVYSAIPPNNATGNFTKIVQRLPVKILVSANQPQARLLRAGLSVETTIETGFADVAGAQAHTDARVTAR